jgi:hypothetical protein
MVSKHSTCYTEFWNEKIGEIPGNEAILEYLNGLSKFQLLYQSREGYKGQGLNEAIKEPPGDCALQKAL